MPSSPTPLFEDNHLLVINKPAGMPSQDDISGDLSVEKWAMAYIREKYNKPGNVYVGLLHRLDRPVAGVMVIAKTSKAAERMSKAFQKRELDKTYFAVTSNPPPKNGDRLEHFLRKMSDRNITQAFLKEVPDSQKAILNYVVLKKSGKKTLLEIKLETGRKHQIRVQLNFIGCPVIGDVKYGAADFLPDKSIALFARKIRFQHPVTKAEMEFVAPFPEADVWEEFSRGE